MFVSFLAKVCCCSEYGYVECIQRLIAANTPPAISSLDNVLFVSTMLWTIPERSMPKIRAKPFWTVPAYLITKPTSIPPALFVKIGMNVDSVHSSKKPRSRISCPSSLVVNVTNSMRMDATHSSTVNKSAFRFPTCRLFCVIAPARPERKEAIIIGTTP